MELNKIHHIDCELYLNDIPKIIDLTITSPPYNLGKKHHTGNNVFNSYDEYIDDINEDEYQKKQIDVLNKIYEKTNDNGSLFYNHKIRIKNGICINPYKWISKTEWILKQEIVWINGSQNFDKCRFFPMGERLYWLVKNKNTKLYNSLNLTDVLNIKPEGTNKLHKRSFPLKLAQSIIILFPESKIIFDPYMGSGTVAIAAINENRKYIGCEISKNYIDICNERIANNNLKLF